jgi:hypothetical protein
LPTGNLPAEGKKLFEEVYQKAKKGSCKGDEACAAGSAWKAVKNAGWKKDANGEWHKSEVFTEFSMRIDKASYDKVTGQRRVSIAASDIDEDNRGDNMSLELFDDFIDRIKKNEPVPEEFQSDFWKSGEPYISVSHYPDANGKTVPGIVDVTYVDGKYLKSKGKFFDTPLGRKCFETICSDLYGATKDREDKVRVSIAFLDYMHKHKSNGFVFDRLNAETTYCPECIMEMLKGENQGKVFLKGHLIHEALTRVPVNTRTSMEVDKSMADKVLTRKDDAASIVGDELADELEEQAEVVGKSEALVIRSDETEELVEEAKTEEAPGKAEEDCKDPKTGEVDPDCMAKKRGETPSTKEQHPKKKSDVVDNTELIRSIVQEVLAESKPEITPETVPSHPLDTYFSEFKNRFDEIINSDVAEDAKLQMVQEPFNALGTGVVSVVKSSIKPKEISPEVRAQSDLVAALSQVMQPLNQKLDLLFTQLSTPQVDKPILAVPQRRSIPPATVIQQMQQQPIKKSETPHLRDIIDKTV